MYTHMPVYICIYLYITLYIYRERESVCVCVCGAVLSGRGLIPAKSEVIEVVIEASRPTASLDT